MSPPALESEMVMSPDFVDLIVFSLLDGRDPPQAASIATKLTIAIDMTIVVILITTSPKRVRALFVLAARPPPGFPVNGIHGRNRRRLTCLRRSRYRFASRKNQRR